MDKKKKSNGRKGGRRESKKNQSTIWKDSIVYLRDTKNYIFAVVFIFLISAFIGFSFPQYFRDFDELILRLTSQIEGLSFLELTWFIFQNNVSAAFFSMIAGIFLEIVPIINATINGVLVGYVYGLAANIVGYGVIWYLLPHGIFELPAIFISLGLGIRFGMFIFAPKGKKALEFKSRFIGGFKVFLTIVLPLLVVAAFVESLLIISG